MRGVKREMVNTLIRTLYEPAEFWELEELINLLQDVKDEFKYDSFFVTVDGENWCIKVHGRREETDKEYEKRCSKIKKRIESKRKVAKKIEEESEETRRKLYEELKKEFG